MRSLSLYVLTAAVSGAVACDSCYGPSSEVVHERLIRRIQPESQESATDPRSPLEWGQIQFMHTTDTHGWLEGHLKEQNYGADWGDFVSFQRHMKQKAGNLGVDLLVVDTGDLHDGAGLSDAALPSGVLSNPIFDEIDYDVLTIGNHELYVSEIAYEHFYNFSKVWGDKYVTSNVQILNPATGNFDYIGAKYRYFTTAHGLRIMTFGVLFDFTGNSNVSKVIKAADMVKQQWFLNAVNFTQPIDLFLLVGHNPVNRKDSSSTFGLVHSTIRALRPDTPIQAFGGHSHIRDFKVYDDKSTAIESGRYCETLGWVSISGIKSSSYTGLMKPRGVANPSKLATNISTSGLVYSRRYLDWNRRTFEYHATNSQASTFDYHSGLRVSSDITAARKKLNLTSLYGCAPETYCLSCKPFGAAGNIFNLIPLALGATVINASRSDVPRFIIINSGSIRFDLVKGPFTYDDSFIVSPFNDAFQYIPNVPYDMARKVLAGLNGAKLQDKRDESLGLNYNSMPSMKDTCVDPTIGFISSTTELKIRGITRRQSVTTPGYVTTDDFGSDGDDTPHVKIPNYIQPNYIQGNGSFPVDGSTPAVVDVVFFDYFAATVVKVLNGFGGAYTLADVSYYVDEKYNAQNYLPDYAKLKWQANVPRCPVGEGIGYDN
ncbi:related to Ser/Thr protein phosphatase family protein [Rhynchosporium secalis]|uniref:Related to Ser/Thr protein phosphatase family protein n=1 Tax=Rhynchosporium secalis TaxID=38038 RepID=A0A1E1MJI3_RHYSE|nr:related to Ser/Thr protein phosphatase family protein [Rhynchosporium secalis]